MGRDALIGQGAHLALFAGALVSLAAASPAGARPWPSTAVSTDAASPWSVRGPLAASPRSACTSALGRDLLLAEEIADCLGVDLGEPNLSEFANGEIHCRYNESIRGADVFIIQSHTHLDDLTLNDSLMEQLIMVDAAKRASAKRISVVAAPTTATPARTARPRAASRSAPSSSPTCSGLRAPPAWSASTSTRARSRASSTARSTTSPPPRSCSTTAATTCPTTWSSSRPTPAG